MAPSVNASGLPSNTSFLEPTQVLNPNGISIGSAVFAELTSVTDRPTDHATRSVTIGRIYVCSTAMRPYVKLLSPLAIIRPYRSTTYVDAACCYRPSSVVCRSVCRTVTLLSPAQTAAQIEMPFGLRTWVGSRNHVLDEGPDPPMGRSNFEGEGRPVVKYRDTLR